MAGDVPHVVILGGGFGGLSAARALRKAKVKVTLVDKRNHHLFQPLLYQVATAGLAATDIAAPIRKVLADQKNTTVLMARAVSIDAARKVVELSEGELSYDYLVVATGMTNDYFGRGEWEAHAPGLKSLEEALEMRRRVLLAYEAAEREVDEKKRARHLTFVVIGGGATGVELSGALAEIGRRTMAQNFRNFDPGQVRVVLLEGGPRLLPAFSEELSERTRKDLVDLGVEVRLGTRASRIDERGVEVGGELIEAGTVLWGAGVRGVALVGTMGVELDRQGRVPVGADLAVKGVEGVYAIGDTARFEAEGGSVLPGVAQVAMQQGRVAAANIVRAIAGKPGEVFRYNDKGSMATIGRSRAIAQIGKVELSGFIAWMMWALIHVLFLIDFRNRVVVLLEWIWAYFSFQRSARIILERPVGRRDDPPRSQRRGAEAAPSPARAE